MSKTGVAVPVPRRFMVPAEAMGDGAVPLEFIKHNLYSCVALDGGAPIPRDLECFNFIQGQTVPGAGAGAIAATQFHTNMQAARTLPKPKTFTVQTVRVVMLPLDFASGSPTIGDDTVAGAAANLDQVDDSILISQSMTARFEIGEKSYLEAPLWMIPSQVGLGGVAATAIANAAGVSRQQRVSVHTAGRGWDFTRSRPPVLWNQQQFRWRFETRWATNPSPVGDRLVYVVFGGILGREVQ